MYEQIVERAAGRFGLGEGKAKQLLGMLVGLIFNPKRGGPAGFLQAFRDQGLGDMANSWLCRGANQAITPTQVESALGADTITSLSSKLGLSREAVGSVAAAMLPDVVDTLSEHGDLGIGIPDKLKGWLGDVLEELGRFGSTTMGATATGAGTAAIGAGAHKDGDIAGDATRVVGAGLNRADDAIDDTARAASGGGVVGKWLPWVLIAALLAGAFLYFQ